MEKQVVSLTMDSASDREPKRGSSINYMDGHI
jgi:hypothetical protein